MIIERLRWWHIEQVVAIEQDLFGAEQWTPSMFWNELANDHYYVAAVDRDAADRDAADRDAADRDAADRDVGDLIGYAGMAINPPDEAWVNNIAVRRDRQRHGVGRSLLDELLGHASRHRIPQTLLEVAADNAPAQRLYDEYGFEAIGVRRGYYQATNTDAVVMRRIGR